MNWTGGRLANNKYKPYPSRRPRLKNPQKSLSTITIRRYLRSASASFLSQPLETPGLKLSDKSDALRPNSIIYQACQCMQCSADKLGYIGKATKREVNSLLVELLARNDWASARRIPLLKRGIGLQNESRN